MIDSSFGKIRKSFDFFQQCLRKFEKNQKKLLSHIDITPERFPDSPGREAGRGGDPRAGQRPDARVRHHDRRNAGGNGKLKHGIFKVGTLWVPASL